MAARGIGAGRTVSRQQTAAIFEAVVDCLSANPPDVLHGVQSETLERGNPCVDIRENTINYKAG